METLKRYLNVFVGRIKNLSSGTIGWIATIYLHCAFLPSLFAVLSGMSDKLPSIDVVFFVWTGLLLFFIRAAILKDMLNLVTNGIGFFIQAVMLALVVFK